MQFGENILAIDSALNGCGVAFACGGQIFEESLPMAHGQAEHLLPMIGRVLDKAGAQYADIQSLVTTNGPGAFTGLRIGLSTAKALALSLEIPLFGITTLQAIALTHLQSHATDTVGVFIDTKRGDFYYQAFDGAGNALAEPMLLSAAALSEQVNLMPIVGDTTGGESGAHIDPAALCHLFIEKSDAFARDPEPVYLRDADVSISKKPQRQMELR